MENLIKTVFSSVCVFCGRVGSMFCLRCLFSCELVNLPLCFVCDQPSFEGSTHKTCVVKGVPSSSFSCLKHEGKVKMCIKHSKLPPYEYGSLKDLIRHGVRYAIDVGFYLFDYVVVPLSISEKEHEKLGFNPARFVGEEISKNLGLKMIDLSLEKGLVVPSKILLVNDVFDKKRLFETSRSLFGAGTADVKCFTLCRVI